MPVTKQKTMTIADDVLKVLSTAEVNNNNILTITEGQLDRKLYVSVNKVLEELGGKWNRKAKGHIFEYDPTIQLDNVLLTKTITFSKEVFGFFPTPRPLAEDLVSQANITDGMSVLEPSVGTGNIADVVKEWYPNCHIHTVEINPKLADALHDKEYGSVIIGDFLELHLSQHDRVVMNPPFERQQDIDHVLHAWKFLKEGGILAAIMSASVEFRENKKTKLFREFIAENNGTITRNAQGSFKDSGTLVNTVTVIISK